MLPKITSRCVAFYRNTQKIIGMGKYADGHEMAIEKAKRSKSERTWVKNRTKRPEGHEYYANDSVSQIPKIGKGRENALNRCGISTIFDCVSHPERMEHLTMEHLTSEKELIKKIIKMGEQIKG